MSTDLREAKSQLGIDLYTVYVRAGLVRSRREFRQFVADGAVKVGERVVRDPYARLALWDGRYFLIEE